MLQIKFRMGIDTHSFFYLHHNLTKETLWGKRKTKTKTKRKRKTKRRRTHV